MPRGWPRQYLTIEVMNTCTMSMEVRYRERKSGCGEFALYAIGLILLILAAAIYALITGDSRDWFEDDDDGSSTKTTVSSGNFVPVSAGAYPTGSGTPLDAAISVQKLEMVQMLLKAGADPNMPGPLGNSSLLHPALQLEHREIQAAIAKAGALASTAIGNEIEAMLDALHTGNAEIF